MWKVVNVSLVALALQLATLAYADPHLTLKVEGPSEVNGVDNLLVTTTVTNDGDQDLLLYRDPNGVLNTFPSKTFKVAKADNDDTVATFIGAKAKYSFALATNLVELKQGESKSFTHQLANAYEIPSTGTYEITPAIKTFYYKDPVTSQPVRLVAELDSSSSSVHAKVSGELKSRHVEKRKRYHEEYRAKRSTTSFVDTVKRSLNIGGKTMELQKRVEYANCNNTQEADILQASYVASLYVADAEKYLTLHKQNTARYNTWFGEYDSGNHDTILSHFTNIRTTDLKTYTYDCECQIDNPEDTFAFVYAGAFGHVYLCGQFMAAPISGPDSKAGTMVHEATHFTKNGGTDDIIYGRPGAQELASTNTTGAVLNADSHEYFAENVPKLG